jgi:hypothetical protein
MGVFDFFKRKSRTVEEQLPTLAREAPTSKPVPQYIMTDDGNITLAWHGKTYSIGKTHSNYDAIVACLTNREFNRLDPLLDVAATIQKAVAGVTVNEYGEVFYRGEQVHGVVVDKISDFVKNQLPYKPLARFLSNLMENPSERSRNELYDFLIHGNFPITHDGCFMAYKGLTGDFKDRHTKTVDNSIGSVNEMPRENVDPDMNVACSTGYHVGTHKYASEFASSDGKLVLVKVNPRDAVSVPRDHSCEKLRVCRYEVVEVCEAVLQQPLYVQPGVQPEKYEDANEDVAFDEDESVTTTIGTFNTSVNVEVKTPKRPACTYCGAKGGKAHKWNCKRPRK